MANYFDTGILLTAGFSLSSQAPLDGRSVVELLTDLDTHIAENRAYEGMCVYVKENKKIYIYNGTTWEEFVGGGSSEKQIKDWVSGSSYLEGDYIYHEGEIYRCLASNNDVDFDETNWKQLTYGIDELSKEDVEGLLGLTEEEIEAMADLILDTEVRIDKTYSSSKIHADIQQCLQDSKDFTLEELGKKIGASYEVVISTDEMVSQDYLYLLNNGNGYDIYIVDVDNIPVVIGETDIDLSNYYNRTEIDTKFEEELGVEVLNTTAQTVKGAINELLVSGDGDSAENITYDNVDYPDMTNVKTALDSIIAKIYYVDTAITSFTMSPSATTYEKGASIPSLTFNWAYNKEVVTQTLTDCVLADATVRTATYNTPLTTTKTFTLTASDGTKSATRNISISFRDKVYFGGATQPDAYDSAFILGLGSANFATAKKGTYTMNVGAGQYGYLAIPTAFGAIDSVWIGGFEVTVDNCGAINFTNTSGYTSSYTIYKTGQQGLGSITMEVK